MDLSLGRIISLFMGPSISDKDDLDKNFKKKHIYKKEDGSEMIYEVTKKDEKIIKKEGKSVIDSDIYDIEVENSTNIAFLLGAGASVPSGIPAVEGLLDELMKRGRKMQNKDINRLVKYCENNDIDNIEDVLTAAYLADFATENSRIASLIEFFLFRDDGNMKDDINSSSVSFLQETLQTLFGLLTSTMLSASPNDAHEAIVDFSQSYRNTSIITTNYDGCIDEAIIQTDTDLEGGLEEESSAPYYFPKQKTLEETAKTNEMNEEKEEQSIELIKIHGSVNWTYCESCQAVHTYNLKEVKRFYQDDIISYPVIGICPDCGGRRRPLLVPPIAFKFLRYPALVGLWQSAKENINDAEYIIVVGYSFADSDDYIRKIIYRSMIENPDQKMILVDMDEDLAPRIKEELSAYGGVDQDRILGATGDAEELVPEILENLSQSEITDYQKKDGSTGEEAESD
jgi:NAD-dependent SIR2 family protein deacetylase